MARLDPQALAQHVDRLHRVAWGLCGSSQEAEDLVQETFARVLAKPRELRDPEDALPYLLRTLRNTFLNARRTASRRPHEVAELDDVVAADPRRAERPEDALETHELLAAVAALPEDFRLALVAVDIAGLSYREAAQALHTQEATIATRLYRARERVAAAWADTAPDPSVGAPTTAGPLARRPPPDREDPASPSGLHR